MKEAAALSLYNALDLLEKTIIEIDKFKDLVIWNDYYSAKKYVYEALLGTLYKLKNVEGLMVLLEQALHFSLNANDDE